MSKFRTVAMECAACTTSRVWNHPTRSTCAATQMTTVNSKTSIARFWSMFSNLGPNIATARRRAMAYAAALQRITALKLRSAASKTAALNPRDVPSASSFPPRSPRSSALFAATLASSSTSSSKSVSGFLSRCRRQSNHRLWNKTSASVRILGAISAYPSSTANMPKSSGTKTPCNELGQFLRTAALTYLTLNMYRSVMYVH